MQKTGLNSKKTADAKNIEVSVVVPVYNEEKNISRLYEELSEVMYKLSSCEAIFVDDGSTDRSFEVLKNIASNYKRVKVIKLVSNYGQSSAIAAGISHSSGSIIVTMDSDLQHDPKDIPLLVRKIKEGYHVVCGWRRSRGSSDSLIKKTMPSKISNFLIRKLIGIKLNDSTGGMRAFSKRVVEIIPLYGEMHRYLPVLAYWKGFKITEVPIRIRNRAYGKTKYDFKRIFTGFMDLITIKFFMKYSARPTYIFGMAGIISFIIGVLIELYFVYLNFISNLKLSEEVPSLLLGVVLMLLGVMLLGFGLIVDMISFDAITSQKRETYIVDKLVTSGNSKNTF